MDILHYLCGYWYRTITIRKHGLSTSFGRMRFLREASAKKYGTRGLSAIDPYARHMDTETFFVHGKLFRRSPRKDED